MVAKLGQEWEDLLTYLGEHELSEEELSAIKLEELRAMVDGAVPDPDQTIIMSWGLSGQVYKVTWNEACGQEVVQHIEQFPRHMSYVDVAKSFVKSL